MFSTMKNSLCLLAAAASTYALNGEIDNNTHPMVGYIVTYNSDGFPVSGCTGSLYNKTVMITAGHCGRDGFYSRVFFNDNAGESLYFPFGEFNEESLEYEWPDSMPKANFHSEFSFDVEKHDDYKDIGLYIFESELPYDGPFVNIPELNQLETYYNAENDATLSVVGYGNVQVKPYAYGKRQRRTTDVDIINLGGDAEKRGSVKVSANANTGGSCFGDSGGPAFINDGSDLVVGAVVSTGLKNCKGQSNYYRLDNQEVLDWLAGYGVVRK
eukprot:Awhi_evm1s13498